MLEHITAAAIVQLAFNEAVKAGAGEVAKKSVNGMLDSLREKIQAQFKDNNRAETALAEFQEQKNTDALDKVTEYLHSEMAKDDVFATEIKQLTEQIRATAHVS
jgi:predicted RNase H-like nuclease